MRSAAEGEADEGAHVGLGLLQHLFDRPRGVFDEGLFHEHVVLKVALELARSDPVDDVLGFALVAGRLTADFEFLLLNL